jgi:L,D-transpeptidase catalytic domain
MSCCQPKHHARFVVFLLAAALSLAPVGRSQQAAAQGTSDTAAEAKKKLAAAGPVLAVVSLAKQRISVYGRAGLIGQSPVSTGMPGFRTPAGVFSVLQKHKFHRSNIYWNAPMPYMQRITWSGVTLHAGPIPRYPASHGCIRLPHQFAVKLWGLTKIGARVVVAPDDASVLDIEPRQLPVPKLMPVPEDAIAVGETANNAVIRQGNLTPQAIKVADASANAASARTRLLNPMERAKVMRELAVADAAAKAKAAKQAAETSTLKAAAANSANAAWRASETALATARARRNAAAKALDQTTLPLSAPAEHALAAADLKVAEAEKVSQDARALEATATAAAMAAAKSASEAEQASREAAIALKAAERGSEPISILISKKAGRLYIRQSWAPIYEAPITFKDPGQPIGTHVYLAVASEGSGENLRWLSVSLASPAQARPRKGAKPRVQELSVAAGPSSSEPLSETATSALNRFELPAEAKRFIEERLWIGASLIVSDEGISNETGTYTDFIVLTR